MKLDITFQDGPVTAEIEVSEDEDYTAILEELADFVEGYGPVSDISEESNNTENLTDPETEDKSSGNGSGKSNSYFGKVDATDTELQRVLKMGDVENGEVNDFPVIIGDTDAIGTSKHKKLLNGIIVILTVLDDVHDVSKVKTSDLKDALKESGLPVDSWGNISKIDSESVYITRKGSGSSATTKIREPGKQDAYKYIQSMVDELRKDEDEES